jgi:8-oxo-dGTP pyrophosphatase MutT (NUDIX family)
MSLLRHIRRCNVYSAERFVPLFRGADRIGLVRRDNAEALRGFPDTFAVAGDAVRLVAPGDFDALSGVVDRVVERLVAEGRVAKWRNEFFAVAPRWDAPPVFKLDRGAVSFFGVCAYGVHLNGYRRDGDALRLWIGRRAPDKKVAPDKLDNLVAGGIGHEHGLAATLIKEASEEADIPEDLIARAVPVGAVSYRMETEYGVRDDVLFLYDLDVPPSFTPRNTDGEIVEFRLMDARDVIERVRRTEDFKFNVNLVLIDFALRHGLVAADDPEYLDLVTGLRRSLD